MILYLYGPDSYRRVRKLRVLIAEYRQKHSQIDLLCADFEEAPDVFEKAKEFLNQPSMFVDSKLLVLKESGAVPTEKEKSLIKILKSHLETPKTFILISDSSAPKKIFGFLLRKPVMTQEFLELRGATLNFFLKQELQERKLALSPDAFGFLSAFIDSQTEKSWTAVNELDKLMLAGFPQPISLTDIRLACPWLNRDEVFYSARKILNTHSISERLALLEKLFLEKAEPAHVFNSLAYQAGGENLLQLADYDISIKSGGLEYEEALADFILASE